MNVIQWCWNFRDLLGVIWKNGEKLKWYDSNICEDEATGIELERGPALYGE